MFMHRYEKSGFSGFGGAKLEQMEQGDYGLFKAAPTFIFFQAARRSPLAKATAPVMPWARFW